MAAHFARSGTSGAHEAGTPRTLPRTGQSHGLRLEEKIAVGYRCENDRLLQSMLKQSREAIKRSQALLLLRIEPFLARTHRDVGV